MHKLFEKIHFTMLKKITDLKNKIKKYKNIKINDYNKDLNC